jgi:hypothetical protein
MKETLRLFGFAALILCALLVGRAYSAYLKRRINTLESLSAMLSELKEGVALFLSTPENFFKDYEDKLLWSSGFLPSVRAGENMADAFLRSDLGAALDERTKKRLLRFFSDFGRTDRNREVERIDAVRSELEDRLKAEREEEPSRVKLAYTLLFAASIGAVILLI